GSSDADGSVVSYAWAFGDGATATGVGASHEYAAAGSYEVGLVVTDDRGATARSTRAVVVTAPAPEETPTSSDIARDAFSRTVQGGLGTADAGGAWTTSGTASSFSVTGGAGRISSERVGVNRSAVLAGASSSSTDLQATLSLDTAPTGGGTYVSVLGRRVSSSSDYRAKVRYLADGRVIVYLVRVVGGAETTLTSTVVPGVTAAAGEKLGVRLQVAGTGSTDLAVKAWDASATEPSAWLARTTDSTSSLQVPGAVGLLLYVSGSGTPASLLVDDLLAVPVAG
ncbi:PKD domain-containing protein, partial [uncultured Pseudokineococcus sp.]|uniref:PKD domain-containing protein n=1 Tax=uncultured Pseudokineococcus sp. TaxID=1642928 RepID=UPI00262AA650